MVLPKTLLGQEEMGFEESTTSRNSCGGYNSLRSLIVNEPRPFRLSLSKLPLVRSKPSLVQYLHPLTNRDSEDQSSSDGFDSSTKDSSVCAPPCSINLSKVKDRMNSRPLTTRFFEKKPKRAEP